MALKLNADAGWKAIERNAAKWPQHELRWLAIGVQQCLLNFRDEISRRFPPGQRVVCRLMDVEVKTGAPESFEAVVSRFQYPFPEMPGSGLIVEAEENVFAQIPRHRQTCCGPNLIVMQWWEVTVE